MKTTIKAKLLSLIYSVIFIAIILIIGILVKLNTDSIKGYDILSETSSKKLILLHKLRKNADNIQFAVLKQILDSSAHKRQEMQMIITKQQKRNDSIYAEYQNLLTTEIEKKLFNNLLFVRKQNNSQRDTLLSFDYDLATSYSKAIYYQRHIQQESYENYQLALTNLINYEEDISKGMLLKLDNIFDKTIIPISICIVLIFIVLIILGVLIRKHLINTKFQNKLLKENEIQIIAEKQYSESILNAAPNGIIGINEQSLICLFNHQAEKTFGYSKADIIGQNLSILIPENFKSKHEDHVHQYFASPADISLHDRPIALFGKRKNGEIFPIEISLSHTDTIHGKMSIAGIKDISERKKIEKRLIQLAEINRNSKTFVGIATLDRKIIYLNPSFRNALGIQPEEELNGLLTTDIYHEEIKGKMAAAFQETLANGIWIGENEIQNKDGVLIPVFQTILMHKDEDGNPEYTSTTMIEITELKQKETELLKINKLFETLSNATKLLVNLTTLDVFYNDICNMIINSGNLNLAWIGQYDPTSSLMIPIGWGGESKKYLQEIEIKVEPDAIIKGPTASALLNGEPFVSNDFYERDNTLEWQGKARKYGIASSAVIPFKLKGKTIGTLNIYSPIKDYFQEQEVALIKEIGSIVTIGINKIQEDKERKELENNRAQLSSIIENTNAYVSITNLDSSYVYMNESARTALGFENEDITKFFANDVFSTESKELMKREVMPALLKNNIWKGEVDFIGRNGSKVYALLVTFLHRDKNGNPIYRSSTAIDITEQKIKEKEKNQLANVIENSSLFVGMANKDRKLMYMNSNFKNALNIPLEEDITKIDVRTFDTPNSAAGKAEILKIVYEKGIWVGESEMKARNGRIFPIIQSIVLNRDLKGIPDFTSTTVLDISEQKNKEKQLVILNEELRSLYNKLQDIKEEERKMIAKEIHDELGQNLTALKLHSTWIKRNIDSDKTLLADKLEEFEKITMETVETSRRLYNNLYPQMLTDIGIIGALQWLLSSYKTTTNIDIEFNTNISQEKGMEINSNISLVLFRIYQECFTNILRYAEANLVVIELRMENEHIVLSIEDDGVGFDINAVDTKAHHGLLGMRERAVSLNGMINFDSTLGKGTKTTVLIPLMEYVE